MEAFRFGPTANEEGGSPLLDRVVQAVRRSLDSLAKVVTNDQLVPLQVAAAFTDTKLYHQLGAVPRAWEVVGRNANALLWESPTVNPFRDRYLLLRASAPVTVTVRLS